MEQPPRTELEVKDPFELAEIVCRYLAEYFEESEIATIEQLDTQDALGMIIGMLYEQGVVDPEALLVQVGILK